MHISDSTCDSTSRLEPVSPENQQTPTWKSVVVVAGAPRSGTSWLGQIIESSPQVAYRFQPFFAYATRDRVTADSSRSEWFDFLHRLYRSSDGFLTQEDKRDTGEYPEFPTQTWPEVLAFKTCRFQYLLPTLLRFFDNAKLVPIMRHPAAVINSWISTPSEFPEGSDIEREWRVGRCKNQGSESEFFGYYKWKELAHLYLDLQDRFPDRVFPIRYEQLVDDTKQLVSQLFQFLQLPITPATTRFVAACHQTHNGSPFAVFKNRSVKDAWRSQLPKHIVDEIEDDLCGTRLEKYIQ